MDLFRRTVVSNLLVVFSVALLAAGSRPSVGDRAPDFSLESLQGTRVTLSDISAQGSTVLLVLRGYPGYQCPICSRQVQEFIRHADGFSAADARVVMIYPGPSDKLKERAAEFTADKMLPGNFVLLLDPDYHFTNLYGLRWDAPRETAYPSTFLIDKEGTVFFQEISDSHGGRTKAQDMIELLSKRH